MSPRSSLIASPIAKARCGQQPDQRVVGRRPQRLADRLLRRGHDRRDVGVGVEEDLAPAPAVGHQAQRGHLGGRVDPAQVAGEAADGGDPPGAGRRDHLGLAGLHPVQRGGDGHGLLAAVVAGRPRSPAAGTLPRSSGAPASGGAAGSHRLPGEDRSCCASGPGLGDRAERGEVDLRVEGGRGQVLVPEHLPDRCQPGAVAQHVGGQCVAQPVRADPGQARRAGRPAPRRRRPGPPGSGRAGPCRSGTGDGTAPRAGRRTSTRPAPRRRRPAAAAGPHGVPCPGRRSRRSASPRRPAGAGPPRSSAGRAWPAASGSRSRGRRPAPGEGCGPAAAERRRAPSSAARWRSASRPPGAPRRRA